MLPLISAEQVPGKEEFYETLRYFAHELASSTVDLRLSTRVDATDLISSGCNASLPPLMTRAMPSPLPSYRP